MEVGNAVFHGESESLLGMDRVVVQFKVDAGV